MSDKYFYPLVMVGIIVMVALAIVWPQGEGARSPAPFGHAIVLPDRVRAEHQKAERKAKKAIDTAHQAALKAQSAETSSVAP